MSSFLHASGAMAQPPGTTVVGTQSSYQGGHPSIQHHSLATSRPPTQSTTPTFSLPALNTRTVLLSTALLSTSALTIYYLSRNYTLSSSFPYFKQRFNPFDDPVVGVHALADIARYRPNRIIIPNPATFIEKRQQLIAGGAQSLQVISDFDHTLSAFTSHSSHGTLEHAAELPADYLPKVQALFDHYYPIEMDHTISREAKEAVMVEWWEAAHALLLEYRFNRSFITSAVAQAITHNKLTYRPHATTVIHYTHTHNIPLLVFSAGLGDTIAEFMAQTGTALPNVDVVSNFMRFDEQTGTLVGFSHDLIHSLNKNYSHVLAQRAERAGGGGGGGGGGSGGGGGVCGLEGVVGRRNVVLLGDSVGDVAMSVGLDDVNVILRVGWLNGPWPVEAEKLAKYEAVYDVLIGSGDGDNAGMEFVLELLQMICEPALAP